MSNPLNSFYYNTEGVRQLISSGLNKVDGGDVPPIEGPATEEMDAMTLKMSDSELLQLKSQWERDSENYHNTVKQRQDTNKAYYLGRQNTGLADIKGVADNILFESEETFLPAALSKNPEPVVYSDNTEQGISLSKDIKTMLQYLSDILTLRLKLKRVVRHWSIYFTGVLKHYWDKKTGEIGIKVVMPQNLRFDKDAFIDDNGDYHGKFLGEINTVEAQELMEMFPKKADEISFSVGGKLATSVTYSEWSTPLYCFYTYKDIVLGKYMNPNWNYESEQPTGEYMEEKEIYEVVPGRNHFPYPKIPYTFFSVFNLGEHPLDDTTLIEQNIPNQDLIVDRNIQIAYNLQNANNGLAVSGDHFNKEDAKEANDAVRKGKGIFVPSGDVTKAVMRLQAPQLPDGVFQELNDKRNELRSIFGVQGLSPAGQSKTDTVRGKILNQSYDTTRIGGGIGDVVAQVADNVFNWWVQMMYVYYDEEHIGMILGDARAVEYVTMARERFDRKIVVSVAPDSMKPKDEVSQMNLATDMFNNGSLDPLSYYEMLNMPDPKKLLERLILWKTNPMAMIGQQDIQQLSSPDQVQSGVEQDIAPADDTTTAANPASASLSQVPINQGAAQPRI